jgi:glutaredoxin/glutathione-dependent peroxiredoxin
MDREIDMVIEVGAQLPDATLLEMGADGAGKVDLKSIAGSGKVAIFGLPGAFTGTCTSAHVPSFIRNMDALKDKGVSAVICVSVNDPFCMKAWGESTGATAAGIRMLGDAGSEFTRAVGLNFSNPDVGFYDRSRRYTMLVEDGKVTQLNIEQSPGVCELSAAETLLSQI